MLRTDADGVARTIPLGGMEPILQTVVAVRARESLPGIERGEALDGVWKSETQQFEWSGIEPITLCVEIEYVA